MTFDELFRSMTNGLTPWAWQRALADRAGPSNHLVKVPTGFGKTMGVLGAWIWHRVIRDNDAWPRRLVWCLPMRVLAEQTQSEACAALARIGRLWDGIGSHEGNVGVHILMGGIDGGDWHLHPEHPAILIGTQDMLLSRALNRGYAAPRARWPMEFGLLSQDCLWVMDEVQLMDVGLATSAQLQAFRDEDRERRIQLRPTATWWMSATLQPGWLAKSPDTTTLAAALGDTRIPPEQRQGHLWEDVSKPCQRVETKNAKAIGRLIGERHLQGGRGASGPTLVVLNRVDTAVEVWDTLRQDKRLHGTDIRLVHSRFRPAERAAWAADFLNRDACAPGTDRIVVATQVIEAGVDYSAAVLVTELAPWTSLVQRFGRCARWGGHAQVVVVDLSPKDDKAAAPYSQAELDAARSAWFALAGATSSGQPQDDTAIVDVAPLALERFEEANPHLLANLYPYDPAHLLLRHELDQLFDTTPDLSGADVDISRFIRSGEERDLHVFWIELLAGEKTPSSDIKPTRDALCAVPFIKAREWLFKPKSEALVPGKRAWVWDWQDGKWRKAGRRDLYPGRTVLVSADSGGYDKERGFSPESKNVQPVASPSAIPADALADDAQDNEALSACAWKTIATHGREAAIEARTIAAVVVPELAELLDLGARHHDLGKIHPAFRGSIRDLQEQPTRPDWAKAPKHAWLPPSQLYPMPDGTRRPGLRHELASTLALFGILQRHRPEHPALLGPWRELLDNAGLRAIAATQRQTGLREPTLIEKEILALDPARFDLLAYLICTHHGKVRLAWHVGKADQNAADSVLRICGIRDGETLPEVMLTASDGSLAELPPTALDLSPAAAGLSPKTGASWTDRVLGLLGRYGPFALAFLEALLRAADQRASRSQVTDPLLETPNDKQGLETDRSAMAESPSAGADPHPPEPNPAQGRPEHGLRGRAGEPANAGSGTQAPRHATRHLTTSLGILTYAELAPHLALRVQDLEVDIAEGRYAIRILDEDLIRDLHQRICGDLVPDIAGRWRRINVRVGSHDAPAYPRVPILMRDYCLDLQARYEALSTVVDERVLEFLAFAEGRLLSIHPFADFNGRATRVFLSELMRRIGLPDIDPTPDPGPSTDRYLDALRAADRADWAPLIDCWKDRFGQEDRA